MKIRPNQGLTINMAAGSGRVPSIPGKPRKPWVWAWNAVGETASLADLYKDGTESLWGNRCTVEKAHDGMKHTINLNGKTDSWVNFHDEKAKNASGQLNWRDTASGDFLHVFVNFSDAGDEIKSGITEGTHDGGDGGQSKFEMYWFTTNDTGYYIGINSYIKKISFSGDRHVFIYDMQTENKASASTISALGTWNDIHSSEREAPIKLEFYLHGLTSASEGKSYTVYGFILASTPLNKEDISYPIEIKNAWS